MIEVLTLSVIFLQAVPVLAVGALLYLLVMLVTCLVRSNGRSRSELSRYMGGKSYRSFGVGQCLR